MEELTQVLSQFTNNSLIDSPLDGSRADLSELDDELPLDSLLPPPENNANTTEELSELTGEVLSKLPLEEATTNLSELDDELPSESPAQVPEGEAEGSSESTSKLLLNSLRHGEMVNRLGCAKSTLSSAKERSDFPQWSKERDPDAIAWTWNKRAKVFVPVTDVPAPKSD